MYWIIILFCSRCLGIIALSLWHIVTCVCCLRRMLLRVVTIYMYNSSYRAWEVFNCFFSILLSSEWFSILRKVSTLEFVAVVNSDTCIPSWPNSTVLNFLVIYYRDLVLIVFYTVLQLYPNVGTQGSEYIKGVFSFRSAAHTIVVWSRCNEICDYSAGTILYCASCNSLIYLPTLTAKKLRKKLKVHVSQESSMLWPSFLEWSGLVIN